MSASTGRRRAGLLIPLFSSPSTTSWGIGDIGDIAPLTDWLAGANCRVLQLLPLNEMAPDQTSPYSALSAMAIDPLYIRMADVPEFAAEGGEDGLPAADRSALEQVRHSPHVDYAAVRALKHAALARAFARFYTDEWQRDGERARALRDFAARQAWWLEDYALFRALHTRQGERPWLEWPEPLQRREPPAIDRARRELSREVVFHQYLQWLADTQWQAARGAARGHGVELFGDLPFMVDGDSADVWARPHHFRLDVSLGVPPDAFSASGQDWGMPVYRWDVIAADDFRWLRDRARRGADLYDGYRVDHLVGFYRTYGRPRHGGEPFFTPPDEASQVALGERVLGILRASGAEIIAEDLGTVPDFVRESLARLEVPGFRVFRWERLWHTDGQPFREPAEYPPASVATTGTHDTETLAAWWDNASVEERRGVAALEAVRAAGRDVDLAARSFDDEVRDILLEALVASRSNLLLLPVQDVFGWRDRINDPSSAGSGNWTYQLPWPVDRLSTVAAARDRQQALRALNERYGRV